jgi:hypothetical protein
MSHVSDLLDFERAHRNERTLSIFVAAPPADPARRTNWYAAVCREFGYIRHRLAAKATEDEQADFNQCVEAFLDHMPPGTRVTHAAAWVWFGTPSGAELMIPLTTSVQTTVVWDLGPHVAPEFIANGNLERILPKAAHASVPS